MSEKEVFVKYQDKLKACMRDYHRYVDSLEGQRNNLLDKVSQLQAERDEFQRRLTFIQDGHNPYEEIKQLQTELKEYRDSVGSASSVKLADGRIKEIEQLQAELVDCKDVIAKGFNAAAEELLKPLQAKLDTARKNGAKLLELLSTALSDIKLLEQALKEKQ